MTQVGNPMTAMAFGVSRLPVDERDGLSGVPGLRFRQFFFVFAQLPFLWSTSIPTYFAGRLGQQSPQHRPDRTAIHADCQRYYEKPHKNLLHLYISRPTKTPPSGPRAKLEKARGSRHVILSVVSNLH